ncbi:MAG TPA: hypothetical protein VLB68_09110, partial [Pyrinomonadaceae bacterium]|nr:hypothetical protein [Pyrinomonadaceae bacterium]
VNQPALLQEHNKQVRHKGLIMIELDQEICRNLDSALSREWLEISVRTVENHISHILDKKFLAIA